MEALMHAMILICTSNKDICKILKNKKLETKGLNWVKWGQWLTQIYLENDLETIVYVCESWKKLIS